MTKKFILHTVKSLNGKTIQTPQLDKIKKIKEEIRKSKENR
jgi:hypothetical protein